MSNFEISQEEFCKIVQNQDVEQPVLNGLGLEEYRLQGSGSDDEQTSVVLSVCS